MFSLRACALAAALGLVGACGSHPASPSALSIVAVSAEGSAWASTPQTFTVTGTGFDSTMTLSLTGPAAPSTPHTLTYAAKNLTSTSFQVSAFLSGSGTFTITVTPAGSVAVSHSFSVAERPLACATPIKLEPQFDPTFPSGPEVIAMLVDRTTVSDTITRLTAQYKFTPKTVYSSLGGFLTRAPDALVDALRCDPAIKSMSYNTAGCFIPEGCGG
jgi:hypothetical protein